MAREQRERLDERAMLEPEPGRQHEQDRISQRCVVLQLRALRTVVRTG